jgi:signal transduction histidine kinase/CheY-like chemotaxis protein
VADLPRAVSIRRKVILALLLSTSSALTLVIAALAVYESATMHTRLVEELRAQARVLAASLHAPLAFSDDEAAAESLRALADVPGIRSARVEDARGEIFASWSPAAAPGGDGDGGGAGASVEAVEDVVSHGERVGRLVIRAASPSLRERAARLAAPVAVAILALVAATAGMAALLRRAVTRPLAELARVAERVAATRDLETRAPVRGGDEIGRLALAWNDVLDRLAGRDRELREALAALGKSEERLRLALDAAGIGTWERVVASDAMTVDARCRRILGLPEGPESVDLATVLAGLPGETAAALVRLARDAERPEAALVGRAEVRVPSPAGDAPRYLDFRHMVVRGEGGRAERIYGTVLDVTEAKRAEEKLVQAQRMESVGRLAGGIAHDFNNLLTVILSSSQLAMASADAKAKRQLESVLKAGHHAADLTRQLLAFARRTVVEPRLVDVNAFVLDAEKLLRRMVGESITVRTIVTPDAGAVLADPGQLTQVLMNLAVNARDAMPRGGVLTITTGEADGGAAAGREGGGGEGAGGGTGRGERAARGVAITVADTGSGIPPEVRGRIFEPFFTTKGVGEGTGLGLATCWGIVTQAGGRIEVESEVGKGSTFRVVLPRAPGAPARGAAAAPAGAAAAERGSGTVLVVEDNPLVRETVVSVLRAQGYSVEHAADAADALRHLEARGGEVRLLLTDVVMPGMNGVELVRRAREKRGDLAVLFASGYAEGQGIAESAGGGAVTRLIAKPFTTDALIAMVREVLREAEARRAGAAAAQAAGSS